MGEIAVRGNLLNVGYIIFFISDPFVSHSSRRCRSLSCPPIFEGTGKEKNEVKYSMFHPQTAQIVKKTLLLPISLDCIQTQTHKENAVTPLLDGPSHD